MGNGRRASDLLVLSLFCLLVYTPFAHGHLSFNRTCGEVGDCPEYFHCDPNHHQCAPCSRICHNDTNNFSPQTCSDLCQDYLHDIHYLKQGDLQDLLRDVAILKVIVVICLIIILLVVAALIAFTVYFYKSLHPKRESPNNNEKNSSQKGMELPTVYNNKYAPSSRGVSPSPPPQATGSPPNSSSPSKSDQLNNSINSSVHSPSVPGTVSTLVLNGSSNSSLQNSLSSTNNSHLNNRFKREPSESTLPDYIPTQSPGGRDPSPHYTHHV